MSIRVVERELARAALAAEIPEPCDIGPKMPPGHEGHHWHDGGYYTACSCGEFTGLACIVPFDDWEAHFARGRYCAICGLHGVNAS